MPDLDTFLEQLSSADPVPGGGSVAALEIAMAAALLEMVANLTIGRRRYLDVQERVTAIRDDARTLRIRSVQLSSDDSDAYGHVVKALHLPRGTDEEKAHRDMVTQAALKEAAKAPLETMKVASRVLDLALELQPIGNRSAISDIGTAASAARSGFHGARLNVEINLAAIRDAEVVGSVRQEAAAITRVDQRADSILGDVLAAIRG